MAAIGALSAWRRRLAVYAESQSKIELPIITGLAQTLITQRED